MVRRSGSLGLPCPPVLPEAYPGRARLAELDHANEDGHPDLQGAPYGGQHHSFNHSRSDRYRSIQGAQELPSHSDRHQPNQGMRPRPCPYPHTNISQVLENCDPHSRAQFFSFLRTLRDNQDEGSKLLRDLRALAVANTEAMEWELTNCVYFVTRDGEAEAMICRRCRYGADREGVVVGPDHDQTSQSRESSQEGNRNEGSSGSSLGDQADQNGA
ncbi:hypothetical protein MMC09_001420 [Bachmanniomyces sp. S44760]|nr:hypothetical protein [Bachmanniomyces sp. S44760]